MKTNIVIFSSGLSAQCGITDSIKNTLNAMGYNCVDWHALFSNAKDSNNIALLPMLIKKIPTFDFGVLICEGHDTTYISRGEHSETVKTMRDNVLFEIGLCAMAIGLNRTILVADADVHLPDDLKGKHGALALKRIPLPACKDPHTLDIAQICRDIHAHIDAEKEHLNQIVIGAAASSACGYATNFICRTLEHIDEEIIIRDGESERSVTVSPTQVYLHIVLPNHVDPEVLSSIKSEQNALLRGTVPTARNRPAEFRFYFDGEDIHIVDYPTNIVTSYDTARIILEMDADDLYDETATDRFVSKEMSLYKSTLKTVLSDAFIRQVIEEHYGKASEETKERLFLNVLGVVKNRLTISGYM